VGAETEMQKKLQNVWPFSDFGLLSYDLTALVFSVMTFLHEGFIKITLVMIILDKKNRA